MELCLEETYLPVYLVEFDGRSCSARGGRRDCYLCPVCKCFGLMSAGSVMAYATKEQILSLRKKTSVKLLTNKPLMYRI